MRRIEVSKWFMRDRYLIASERHNRKRPTGEAGRFWGYYREER
jgi:hypothetical protein